MNNKQLDLVTGSTAEAEDYVSDALKALGYAAASLAEANSYIHEADEEIDRLCSYINALEDELADAQARISELEAAQ